MSVESYKPNPGTKKRKKKRSRNSKGRTSQKLYPLVCLDSETTNHGELLELSVFDIDGKEIYHSYFKPRAKRWPTDIHHITPEMVSDCKSFGAHRKEIQQLLNSSEFVLGCALCNDLRTLRRYGLELRKDVKILDIQNWYWLLNDESERKEKRQTGLSAIAARYGLGFGVGQPHSATADTKLTLDCFKALASDFDSRYPALETADTRDLKSLYAGFDAEYRKAMQIYRMNGASGYMNVVRRDKGFSFKYSKTLAPENDKIVLSVPVNDRVKAEDDMRARFAPIQLKGLTGIYDLKEKDFDFIRSYTNELTLADFIEREKLKEKTSQPLNPLRKRVARISRDDNFRRG